MGGGGAAVHTGPALEAALARLRDRSETLAVSRLYAPRFKAM